MKSLTKTYQAIQFINYFTTTIVTSKGKSYELPVHFMGGSTSPIVRNGTFTTSDPDVQKSLEDSGSFNVSYKLIDTTEVAKVVDKKDLLKNVVTEFTSNPNGTTPNNPNLGQDEVPEEVLTDTPKDIPDHTSDGPTIKVPIIANFQSAKGYILENFKDITLAQVATKELLLTTAKTLNIEFIDMK